MSNLDWINLNTSYYSKNKFCVFKSINNGLYLIFYLIGSKELISYDLNNNVIINKIKNPNIPSFYSEYTCIRHFLDYINKRDLILTSEPSSKLQIWDFRNLECIISIENIYSKGALNSACIINDGNQNYFLTSCLNWPEGISDLIKVYDFKGNIIKVINDSEDSVIYIDVYYDIKQSKNFIITCCYDFVKAYDFSENKIYQKFSESNDNTPYYDFIIRDNKGVTEIICSNFECMIKVFNFHNGDLLNKFKINENSRGYGINLWKNEFLFIGLKNKVIRYINLKTKKLIELKGHEYRPILIVIIDNINKDKLLISGDNNEVIIWENKNCNFIIKRVINLYKVGN